MERLCAHEDCPTLLSDQVPSNVIYCGKHQHWLKTLKERYRGTFLTESDLDFLFRHDWGCTIRELSEHLGLPITTLYGRIQAGRIPVFQMSERKLHYISIEDAEKAIDFARNWVGVAWTARTYKLHPALFPYYVRRGYFGVFKHDFAGRLVIHRKYLQGIVTRYKAIASRRYKSERWPRKFLNKGEATAGMLAGIVGVTPDAIYNWIELGYLPFHQRKCRKAIKKNDFLTFAQEAIAGRFATIKPETQRKLNRYLQQAPVS